MTRTWIGKMMKGVQPNPELHLIAQMNSCAAFKFNNQAFFYGGTGAEEKCPTALLPASRF